MDDTCALLSWHQLAFRETVSCLSRATSLLRVTSVLRVKSIKNERFINTGHHEPGTRWHMSHVPRVITRSAGVRVAWRVARELVVGVGL
jgi:hypothetical protein